MVKSRNKKGWIVLAVLFALFAFFIRGALAVCPACVGGYRPVRGTGGSLAEGSSIGLGYSYLVRSRLYQDGKRIENPNNLSLLAHAAFINLDYEIRHPFILGLQIPFVSYAGQMPGPGGTTLRPQSTGLGDIIFLTKFGFGSRSPGASRASLFLGFKTPTGKRSSRDPAGNISPITFQPGTGSFDFLAGLSAVKPLKAWTFYGEITGRRNMPAEGVRAGDDVSLSAALSRSLAGAFLAVGNMNLSWQGESSGDILSPVGTGGRRLFSEIGIQWLPFLRGRLEAALRIPIFQNLNGLQLGEALGLVTSARLSF